MDYKTCSGTPSALGAWRRLRGDLPAASTPTVFDCLPAEADSPKMRPRLAPGDLILKT